MPEPRRRLRLSITFQSLRHPNYRLWFTGQVVSLFGTWMQSTAQGYFIYDLTRSPAYLGYVSFANGLPAWLLTLYGGLVADRFARRSVLVVTQTTAMLLAFVLAALSFARIVQPWHILVLATLSGIVNAFDAPARQSFVMELVQREDLTNAIALNSTMFNMATALGPAVGGLVYAAFGPAWCFTINGVSFLAVIGALLRMRLAPARNVGRRGAALRDIWEGIRYSLREPAIRLLTLIAGLVTLFGFSVLTLIPAWSVEILQGDATTNGLLQSARGVGALASALTIASLGAFTFRGKFLLAGLASLPVFIFLFSRTTTLWLSVLTLAGVGAAIIAVYNLCNSLIQTRVEDRLRGRVMAFYTVVFSGMLPLGGLVVGQVAEWIGAIPTVTGCAALCGLLAIVLWLAAPALRTLQ